LKRWFFPFFHGENDDEGSQEAVNTSKFEAPKFEEPGIPKRNQKIALEHDIPKLDKG
jgi:hypothetical protein